jgi:hypothetical protein
MAINPNTDFTAGQVLTAAQQNRFPRGVMAYNSATSSTANFTSETLTLSATTFTAVANRYYKITYYEPSVTTQSGTVNRTEMYVRQNNISGTLLATSIQNPTSNRTTGIVSFVTTFSAGSVTLVGTCLAVGSSPVINCIRASNTVAYLLVEDLGPA